LRSTATSRDGTFPRGAEGKHFRNPKIQDDDIWPSAMVPIQDRFAGYWVRIEKAVRGTRLGLVGSVAIPGRPLKSVVPYRSCPTVISKGAPESATKRGLNLLRETALCPTPNLPGLRARHWQAGRRRGIEGRYLFADRTAAEAFARRLEGDPVITGLSEFLRQSLQNEGLEELGDAEIFNRPVFIISAPRAGSTLLYELLEQSGTFWRTGVESEGIIEGIPALHLANRGFNSHRLTDIDADAETVRTLRAAFVAEIRDRSGQRYVETQDEARPATVRMLEKTPETSLRIPFLAAAFPSACFVFLHRDARQNVSSIIEGWRHDGITNIPALPGWPPGRWNFLLPEGWRGLCGASLLEVAAFQWNAANQRTLDDLETLERSRWISLEYTELVAAPRAVVSRICDFAGIPVHEYLSAVLARPLPVSIHGD
jgi:LPS sulfotransferase NodH